jgi:hypothetical protein
MNEWTKKALPIDRICPLCVVFSLLLFCFCALLFPIRALASAAYTPPVALLSFPLAEEKKMSRRLVGHLRPMGGRNYGILVRPFLL